jgi:putative metallohydrolase (TIGR04338 family)
MTKALDRTADAQHSCQQDQVYDAESTVEHGQRFRDLNEVQRFVDKLRNTWWWELWLQNVKRVEIGRSRSRRYSVGDYYPHKEAGSCEFYSDTPSIQLVIHELAHVLAKARRGSESHDPWFARIYCELTYLIRGTDAWHELAIAFDHYGVDYDAGGLR